MIFRTKTGNKQLRTHITPYQSDAIPTNGSMSLAYTGKHVTTSTAMTLPAVLAAIRLLSETAGGLPLKVYRENANGQKELATDTWQYQLLCKKPSEYHTPFEFKSSAVALLNGFGNAYFLKLKTQNRVTELIPLDNSRVEVIRPKNALESVKYGVRDGSKVTILDSSQVLHMKGFVFGDIEGLAPLMVCKQAIASGMALEEFMGRFFANNATPSGVLTSRDDLASNQLDQLKKQWNAGFQGTPNAHKVAFLPAGWEFQAIGVDLQSAQWAESMRFTVQEIARIFNVPAGMLGDTSAAQLSSVEQEGQRFKTYSLNPWLRRIEEALMADESLFPMGSNLSVAFDTSELERTDFKSQWEGWLKARQAGVLTPNEIRAKVGEEPHPEGDELQQTPVGGAPNEKKQEDMQEQQRSRSGHQYREMQAPNIVVQVPEQPAPIVNIDIPETVINLPEQPAPVVNVDPVINVEVPEIQVPEFPEVNVPAPVVNVEPIINVEVPSPEAKQLTVVRDDKGQIKRIEQG